MIKACAEHALTTCLRGYESTKAQGPMCFSCRGLGLGAAEDRVTRKESGKQHRNASFKTMTALLSPSF